MQTLTATVLSDLCEDVYLAHNTQRRRKFIAAMTMGACPPGASFQMHSCGTSAAMNRPTCTQFGISTLLWRMPTLCVGRKHEAGNVAKTRQGLVGPL